MRIVFAGTPHFAAVALESILRAGHTVDLVLTQPERPAGRGWKPRPSEVGILAAARGLPLAAPRTLREIDNDDGARAALDALRAAAPDLLVVAAYGLILPQSVLDIPRGLSGRGGVVRAINIHASLLPRWRGAAPIARAIEAGDTATGITLMQMEVGLDTGPILRAQAIPIEPDDTAGTLTERLAQVGATLTTTWLAKAADGGWEAVAQPADGVTHARKIGRDEAALDWSASAAALARRVRAFDPQPGACGHLDGRLVKIWSAQATEEAHGAEPGVVLAATDEGVRVACGQGVIVIRELQRAGGRRLRVHEFLRGTPIVPGARWQSS
ncbi:MAG: methionyl-tRNA formyltransferase [Burkholderiaceae bacterium]|nr:methionyl-tRNA formyltransferase [Burkholderiaceae bacterium]